MSVQVSCDCFIYAVVKYFKNCMVFKPRSELPGTSDLFHHIKIFKVLISFASYFLVAHAMVLFPFCSITCSMVSGAIPQVDNISFIVRVE